MGLVSPMECRNHFLSTYASGILANFYHPEPPIPERDFNDCSGELCLSKTPIPRECCRKLGLKPKRDDFEYDYDNDAELPITRIRVDFLDDDHYRGLVLALVDMYEERLRRRRLHHVLLANLNLLTHLLPGLLPQHYAPAAARATATSGYHNSGQARAVLDQSRRADSALVRKRLVANQRRRRQQFLGRGFLAASRMKFPLGHQHLEDSSVKSQQPPSSVESLHDSGVGYSESPLHSVPSVDNSNGVTNWSSVGDAAEGEKTPTKNDSTPVLETGVCHPPTANISRKVSLSQTTMTDKKPLHKSIFDPPSAQETNKCCIPPYISEPLKPLLRFLSALEADTLLNQLHREHILRQEIEQLQQLKRSQNGFLNETRLAGCMTSPTKVDSSEEESSDEEQPKKADQQFLTRTSIPSFTQLRRRRSRSLFNCVRRGAKRHTETTVPPPRVCHRTGLRSDRATGSTSRSSRGTKRRGRPPLHHQGSRQHQRPFIRT
nr:Transcriptional adapter 2B [Hymenolepis microstoma]